MRRATSLLAVIRAQLIDLTKAADERGLLTAAQYSDQLPFAPIRIFIVTQSPAGTIRGGHAHRTCHQILVATAGRVVVEFDDDGGTQSFVLGDATKALHLPPLVWARQTYATEGASLVVLASHAYDAEDYIDDREAARSLRAAST